MRPYPGSSSSTSWSTACPTSSGSPSTSATWSSLMGRSGRSCGRPGAERSAWEAPRRVSTVDRLLIDRALELDKAYIPTRYPNAHPSGTPGDRYTADEAGGLITHAEAILAFCQDLLS